MATTSKSEKRSTRLKTWKTAAIEKPESGAAIIPSVIVSQDCWMAVTSVSGFELTLTPRCNDFKASSAVY